MRVGKCEGCSERAGFTVELGGAGLAHQSLGQMGLQKTVLAIATEVDALQERSQTPGTPLASGWSKGPGSYERCASLR
jgi:hypothetical protein